MPEYINVDLMKEMLIEVADGNKEKLRIAKKFSQMLDVTPKADVEPVVHAQWGSCKSRETYFETYSCSRCGRTIRARKTTVLEEFSYCHCGAKMDKVVNDKG